MNVKITAPGGYNILNITPPAEGDAGYDLYASLDKPVTIRESRFATIPTGVAVEIPEGHVGLIMDRSSWANNGLHVMGGVIDSGYRGEIKVLMMNLSSFNYLVEVGVKVAQMIIVPCYTKPVVLVRDLTPTTRGSNGFGSTGN